MTEIQRLNVVSALPNRLADTPERRAAQEIGNVITTEAANAASANAFAEFAAPRTYIEDKPEEGPRPLRRPVADAEPFPLAALGSILEPAARAIADRVQCPPALAGISVLAAGALAVQAFADVQHPMAHRPRPVSLFMMTVGASGERKSAADAEALAPVREREGELRSQYDAETPSFLNAKRAYEAAKAHAEKANKGDFAAIKAALEALGPEPRAPMLPLLRVSEPTFEGLCRLLQNGQPSLGLFSDEGGSFVGGHAMSDEAKLRTLTGLSSLWDGSAINRVRSGEGSSVLTGKRLSAHLMMQPGVASGLLCDAVATDQGFLPRTLVSYPKSTAGTRLYRPEPPGTAAALGAYHRRIIGILRESAPMVPAKVNELAPRVLSLSRDAHQLFVALYNATERSLGPGGPYEPVRGLANKLAEHALRMAAVLALVENISAVEVGEQHMQCAAMLADHFAGEALRLWDAGAVSPDIQSAERLLSWLHTGWPEANIGLSVVYRLGPNSLREKAVAQRVVSILEDHGWLKRLDGPQIIAGKPAREAWRIVREG